MAQFVLVHGSWHGAWCWSRVLPLLRSAGHAAYAVTLTGVGERAHLMGPDIRLKTHVTDVVNLITSEELDEVVLVGHSYGGIVITGVADKLMAQHPGLFRHLVYVDAVIPLPGESWSSCHAPETVAARVTAAKAAGGVIPCPDASLFGLEGADRDWVNRRMTPQPFAVYTDPLDFDAARVASVPRTFIDCTRPALATISVMRQRARQGNSWHVAEMATGHDPMVSDPAGLSRILLHAAVNSA
jgi:pimeloyl-ACP methyl ester carboxylesterase